MLSYEILIELKKYIINNNYSLCDNIITLTDNSSDSLETSEEIEADICCYESCINYDSDDFDVKLDSLIHFIQTNQNHTFQELLFKYIDENKLCDSDVYKRANIDRRLFSKIRCDKNYKPSKSTVISLGLAMKLTKEKTEELLESVGYTLSNSSTFDLIICFCIEQKIFNILQVNYALDKYDCVNL